jgi:hypothetical protein
MGCIEYRKRRVRQPPLSQPLILIHPAIAVPLARLQIDAETLRVFHSPQYQPLE